MQRAHGSTPGEHLSSYHTPGAHTSFTGYSEDSAPWAGSGAQGGHGTHGGHMHTTSSHQYAGGHPEHPGYHDTVHMNSPNERRVTLPPLRGHSSGKPSPGPERAGLPRAMWTSGSPYIPRRLGETEGVAANGEGHQATHPDYSSGHIGSRGPHSGDHAPHDHSPLVPGRLGSTAHGVSGMKGHFTPKTDAQSRHDKGDPGAGSDLHGAVHSGPQSHATASAIRMAQIGAAFDSEVSHFRQQVTELQVERDALAATNSALHSRVEADARLTASLHEVQEAKTALEQQLAVTSAQLEAQTTLSQQLQGANNNLVAERTSLLADKAALEEERDQLAKSAEANRAEAVANSDETQSEKTARLEVQAALDAALASLKALQDEKETLAAEYDAKVAALSDVVARLDAETEVSAGLRTDLERECKERDVAAAEALSKAAEEHTAVQSRLEDELRELKTILEQRHEAAIEAAATYATELATTKVEAEAKLAARTAELHAINAATQSTHSELNGELETLRRSSMAFNSEVAQLRQTLRERQAEIDDLNTELTKHEELAHEARRAGTQCIHRLRNFVGAVTSAVGSAQAGNLSDTDPETPTPATSDIDALGTSRGDISTPSDADLASVTQSVASLRDRAEAAERTIEEASKVAVTEPAQASVAVKEIETKLMTIAKTLVGDIQSLAHDPQADEPSGAAMVLERMTQLKAMCADGEHSAGEDDSWAWVGFNSVVVAAAEVAIPALENSVAALDAVDLKGMEATKHELAALQAHVAGLLETISANGTADVDLDGKISAAKENIVMLQTTAAKATVLEAELQAAKDAIELAQFAGSKDQIENDRKALEDAHASEAALADEVAELRETLKSSSAKVEELQSEIILLEETSMVKVAQVRDLEGQVAQLEAEIASAQAKTVELSDALSIAEDQLTSDDVRTQLDKAHAEIERLKKLLTDTNDARHIRLENENHALRKAIDAANAERDAAVASRDRKAQMDAKDIAIERSIRVQLEKEKDEMKAQLLKLTGADELTDVLQKEKAHLEERVEQLEAELAEQIARVAEIEVEMEEIGARAAKEIEERTAGAAKKMQELEDERDVANAKAAAAEAARQEAAELARERGELIEDLEKKLRIATARIEKTDAIEQLKAETYRLCLDRYERTVRELGNLLNLELEPLQREIIEAPLDPDVRPKDAWDPHCDRLDKKLQARVKALHEQIDDIPNQIAEVEAQGVAECEKQKAAYEKIVAQMKTKLIRKEEMFNALTKQLDELDSLKMECDLEKKRVAQGQQELARIRDKLRVQRDEIEALDSQLLEERALKEALIKRMEVAAASKSVPRASRVTMVDPGLAASLKRNNTHRGANRPRPPPK